MQKAKQVCAALGFDFDTVARVANGSSLSLSLSLSHFSRGCAGEAALEIPEEHASEFDNIVRKLKDVDPLATAKTIRDVTRQKISHLLISIPGDKVRNRSTAAFLAKTAVACFVLGALVLVARVGGHPEWHAVIARSVG